MLRRFRLEEKVFDDGLKLRVGNAVHKARGAVLLAVLFAFCEPLAACGPQSGAVVPPRMNVSASTPNGVMPAGSIRAMSMAPSVSPGSIPVPPMIVRPLLPASAMQARRHTEAIGMASWTSIPGSASRLAASPDGSLWAISDQPSSSADKYIWHYTGGSWTNIPGSGTRIAVAPDGTVYVVNSAGGIYAYSNGSWNGLTGGASDVTAAADNTIYVISNKPGNSDGNGIWHYANNTWTQIPGSATQIAASRDTASYTTPSGPVNAGGFFVMNASGYIYYYNVAAASWTGLPGAGIGILPTLNGGFFVLGFPQGSNGSPIYFYDLTNPGWSSFPGSGYNLTIWSGTLFVVGGSNAIYLNTVTTLINGGGFTIQ